MSNSANRPGTAADFVAEFLVSKGVTAVFELSGGMITFITDAIFRSGKIRIVNMRHEQAAGFAAEGAARVGKVAGVALATSGPGATNLVTAIGSAYFDSTPMIFITGQVNQSEIRSNQHQRQNGFQELDIVSVVRGITKLAIQVKSTKELEFALNHAWEIAHSGRPGPVLIDIPIDVQQMQMSNFQDSKSNNLYSKEKYPNLSDLETMYQWLNESRYPLLLVGGGVRHGKATNLLRDIVERLEIPTVHSLMAVDVLPSSSEFRVGMIGSYGNRWANKALAKADCLIVLGSRLDVRQTGTDATNFVKGKRIIRVDIDEHELNGRVNAQLNFKQNVVTFLENLELNQFSLSCAKFSAEISRWRSKYPAENEQIEDIALNPNFLMSVLSEIFQEVDGFVVDVGQHQMWAAQSINIKMNQRFVTSGGMGAMGFSIPASIGCAMETGGKWVVVAGDGCVQLSLPELQTIKHYNLPIAICIINNNQLGMVAQFQEENMNSRFVSTREGYSNPDFIALAEGFGIPSFLIQKKEDVSSLESFIADWRTGPVLIEIQISQNAKALPKLSRNAGLADL